MGHIVHCKIYIREMLCKVCEVLNLSVRFQIPVSCPGSDLMWSFRLFLRHRRREGQDVLSLLQRGQVNHAAAEGERTLERKANTALETHISDI